MKSQPNIVPKKGKAKRPAPSPNARRKKLDPDQKRSQWIKARVTDEERERILRHAVAAGVSESVFIRDAALKRKTEPRAKADPDFELVMQLKAIGNNLNQLAHIANRSKRIPAGLAEAQSTLADALMKIIAK